MADKESTLAIVIRTVDNATAGLKSINAKIKSLGVLAAPVQLVGERFGALGKEIGAIGSTLGIPKLASGVKGVGSAVGDLAGKLAVVGGIAAGFAVAAGRELLDLVGHFDDLGDRSERLGVTNDFLASMEYAAEKAGAPLEALDNGLQAFSENLGAARASTGRMTAFLQKVSPALLSQLKAAKSTEGAFRLLADAMAKIEDPAKRLKLAQATVGDAALAPLLAKGSAGLLELQGSYIALAGSQEDAAEKAGAVDDSMHDLKAASDGVKAALVAGLSPAIKTIIEQITEWLSGHRDDVRRWAEDIGKKLPGAVSAVVDAVKGAVAFVGNFVDSIGGWKVAALGVAAVLSGPLIGAVIALGAAIAASPIGAFIMGASALIAAGQLFSKSDEQKQTESDAETRLYRMRRGLNPDGTAPKEYSVRDAINAANAEINLAVGRQQPNAVAGGTTSALFDPALRDLSSLALPGAQQQQAIIKVDFANAPPGTRVTADPRNTATVDMTTGYQLHPGGI